MPLLPEAKNCDISVKKNFQLISNKLGYTAIPPFASMTLTDLTASSLVGTNASKLLESVTIGSSLTYTRPTLDAIQDIRTTATPMFARATLTDTCLVAGGANFLRVTGLQTDGTAMTGTLRGAYIDVSNGSTAATGTIRGVELKARTEAPGDIGNDVNVLEGLSISADSKDHSVTTMRAAEFILDGSTGGTITEAVGLRIANNLQANKATTSYGLQIYRDSFNYTYDISLSLGGHITGDSYIDQDLRTTANPTFNQITLTGYLVMGDGMSIGQKTTGTYIKFDDTNNYMVLMGGNVGLGVLLPSVRLHVYGTTVTTDIRRDVSDSVFAMSGGNASNDGANLLFYGSTHASLANICKFRYGSTVTIEILGDGGIKMPEMKSGTDQTDAGAAADELYFDTNDDNTVKMGV